MKTKMQTTGTGPKRVRRSAMILMLALGLFASVMSTTRAEAATTTKPPLKITHPGDKGASAAVQTTAAQLKAAQALVDYYMANKAEITKMLQAAPKLPITNANGCTGFNGWYSYSEWYSGPVVVVSFDSCRMTTILSAWEGGNAFLALFAFIALASGAGAPIAAITGAVGVFSAVGRFALTQCARDGRGTDIRRTAYGAIWCNNQ